MAQQPLQPLPRFDAEKMPAAAKRTQETPRAPFEIVQKPLEQAPLSTKEQLKPKEKTRQLEIEDLSSRATGLLRKLTPKKKTVPLPLPVQPKDEVTKKIETIMSEGMAEIYNSLPTIKQVEFRTKGEDAAQKIRSLMHKPKLHLKKLLRILLDWMKVIPGVNRFFLEQEAKIKAERIIELHEEEKNK